MRSKRSSMPSAQSPRRNSARLGHAEPRGVARAHSRAPLPTRRCQARSRCGHWSSAASSSVPGPVPRSRMRFGPGGPGEMLDRRGDQRFAVGPRHQHARADFQLDRPEGALAGDVGDRLALRAAARPSRESRRAPRPGGRRGAAGRGRCPAHAAISSSASSRGVSLVWLSCSVARPSARGIAVTPPRGRPAARPRPRRSARRPARRGPALRGSRRACAASG